MHSLRAISRKVAKTRYNIRLCRQPQSLHGINSVPVLMLCLSVDCTIFLYSTVLVLGYGLHYLLVLGYGLHYLAIQYPCCHPLSCYTISLLSPTIFLYNILAVTHYLPIQYPCCHPLSCYTISLLSPAILLYNILAVTHYPAIQYPCCHPLSCYTISLLSSTILLYNTVFTFGCRLHFLAIQYLCCHHHNFFCQSVLV